MDDLQAYCKNLPKIELHAHLNGSLSISTMKELEKLCINNPVDLQSILSYRISKGSFTSLSKCFELFRVAHMLTSTKEGLSLATTRVIEEFAADNVVYLELRTTPREIECVMTKREYLDVVIAAIKAARKTVPSIIVKLLVSIDRRHSYLESFDVITLAIDQAGLHPDIVCGVDLCGDPNKGSFHCKLFEHARLSGLKVTLHCAEVFKESEVLSMLQFNPDRIGHGTFIHPNSGGSEILFKLLIKANIPVECCLTSNVKTETTKTYADHHIKYLLHKSHPIAISTDDKGVFETELSDEYFICAKTFNLSKSELWNLCYESINFIFGNEAEKRLLRKLLLTQK